MRDFLAGVPAGVEDDPVAGRGHALLAGRPPGGVEKLADEALGPRGRVVERGEMQLGDDQHVDRRLGPDVLEGDDVGGLEQDPGRELPPRDAAEEAAGVLRDGHAWTLSIEAPSPRSFSSMRS